jgi:hypothetical protein
MRKLFVPALAAAITISSIAGCTTSQLTTTATTAATTLLSSLGPYLIQLLGNVPALKGVMANANMNTQLSSILTNPTTITAFKNAITTNFKISSSKVNSAYGSFGTLQDVANFIAKNGDLSALSGLR